MNNEDETKENIERRAKGREFLDLTGTSFEFEQDGRTFTAKLIEAESKVTHKYESVSLLFVLPPDFAPLQGEYFYRHDELGSGSLFIVPIERTTEGLVFEAVFNNLVNS